MTLDEAIAILSDMKIDIPVPKAAVTQKKRNVALDMAINALNCSEIPNSSDSISRQAAIDAVKKHYRTHDNDLLELIAFDIERLPPAQGKPFNLPEIYIADGYDTIEGEDGNVGFGVYVPDENQIYVAGDVEGEIRARALLHEICHWVQAMCGRPFDEDEANEFSDIIYDALPSAQPEDVVGIINNSIDNALTLLDSIHSSGRMMYYSDYCALHDAISSISVQPDHTADVSKKVEKEDCVSRQAAIDALDEQIEQCNKALGSFYISLKDEYAIKVERASLKAYKEQLKNLPSAQPEIIRCKDCKYWKRSSCCEGYCGEIDMEGFDEDHYCGFAERRTE